MLSVEEHLDRFDPAPDVGADSKLANLHCGSLPFTD